MGSDSIDFANMVVHPEEYPWASYRHNALGEMSSFVTHHSLYQSLGATAKQRQAGYRALFQPEIPMQTLDEIRTATNKAWVLGSDYFKEGYHHSLIDRPGQTPKVVIGSQKIFMSSRKSIESDPLVMTPWL